ncbi:hypothetical protein OG194_29715 [Streptomyces sp. NBC_01288]|uniref:hypothetical protein n=1 Tax=Streptomyces sp. NBC_01288 TaxID=2903814 RepID=UPI002E15DC59|nr:hypothetical protein OG194_29715 [Streptomyces sp. NBC_01288]
MGHATDQPPEQHSPEPTNRNLSTDELVRQMLVEMAERLEANRPDVTLTPTGRIAIIQATTMSPNFSSALRAKAPDVEKPITRAAYAQLLRAAADPDQPSLLDRYAAASQRCRQIGQQVGLRRCDEDPEWRAAEREAEALWKIGLAAGHTRDELIAASKPSGQST